MPAPTRDQLLARLRRGLLGGSAIVLIGLALFAAAWKAGWVWFVHPSASRYPIRGIDVSHHQGEIAWAEVAADGVRFAWIKATEGADWSDPSFAANRTGAAAAALPWGPTHFYTFCSPPQAQAAHFLAVVGADSGTLPPAVDVERGGNCAGQLKGADLGTFLDLVEAGLHRPAILYVLKGQMADLFGAEGPPDRPLWVRDLYLEPSLVGGLTWTVWQYHACGWVWGIHACTDRDVFSGDEAAFQRWILTSK